MQESSRSRKSASNRDRRGKVGRVAKAAKAASQSTRGLRVDCPTHRLGPATKDGSVRVIAKGSNQAVLLDLLKRLAGAAIVALMDASGWQQHSVCGFLTGVVRKKLGLELVSAVEGDQRIYRVVAPKRA